MIDFILPWVDNSDPDWQKEKGMHGKGDAMRFRDMDTLKYVLRSIEQYAPWYHKVHLITAGHYPDWLNKDHVNLITHDELYYDKSHLPTFNSSSIEMNLPNLKNVEEKIIYLNDDTLLFDNLTEDRFFQKDLPVDFLSHGWIPRNIIYQLIRGKNEWVYSLNNNLKLINQTFKPFKFQKESLYHESYDFTDKLRNFLMENIYKKFFWIEHWHHPRSYNMKTLRDCYFHYEKEMMVCSKNKFRSNNDLTQYLYRYWHLAKQEFVPYKHNDGYISRITSYDSLKKSILFLDKSKGYNFVCFNDNMTSITDNEFNKTKSLLVTYLNNKFPRKSIFEN